MDPFHPDLVAPFYLQLTNANILFELQADRLRFAQTFRETLPKYSTELLREMLNDSWRPAKVAAWVTAATKNYSLVGEVCNRLKVSPDHVEHLCLALAVLNTPESEVGLAEYLTQVATESEFSESVSADWAVASLGFLQRSTDSGEGEKLWNVFLESRNSALEEHWQRRLKRAQSLIPRAVSFIESNLSAPVL